MPKRHREYETDEQRWERKRKRYEEKLRRRRGRPGVIYSDDENHYNDDRVPYFWDETPRVEYEQSVADESLFDGQESPMVRSPPRSPRSTATPLLPDQSASGADGDAAGAIATDDVIDSELLLALGNFEEEKTDWGPDVAEHIAVRVKSLLLNGMQKDEKEAVLKRYLFPKNIQLTKAPALNPEITAMLTEQSRNRDKRVLTKQNQIGTALSAVAKAITLLLNKDYKIVEVLTVLADASRLLADSHHLETVTRRSLVTPLMEKGMIEAFKDRSRDDYLFGANLGELIKSSQGIKKTGQLLQAPRLNSKGPRGHHRLRGYATRVGGQKHNYPNRRQQPPVAPPPAGRRPNNGSRRQQQAAAPARNAAAPDPAPAGRT